MMAAAAAPASPDTPTQARPEVSPANQKSNGLGGFSAWAEHLAQGEGSDPELQSPAGSECLRRQGGHLEGVRPAPSAPLQPQLLSPLPQHLQLCSAAPQEHPCCPLPECRAAMSPGLSSPVCHICNATPPALSCTILGFVFQVIPTPQCSQKQFCNNLLLPKYILWGFHFF